MLQINIYISGNFQPSSSFADLTLGEGASSNNTVTDDTACFYFNQTEDAIKEGLEVLAFLLSSEDPYVCLGRDLTLVTIPANGSEDDNSYSSNFVSMYIMLALYHLCHVCRCDCKYYWWRQDC